MGDSRSLTFTAWVSDLAREHTRVLAAVARHEGLTADDALDAVQEAFETFLRLPQGRSLVGEPEDSRALMIAIVRNAARNLRRRHHRSRAHDAIEEGSFATDGVPSVGELIERAEEHARLRGCVNHLAEIQRQVVRMRMLEEASAVEVATKLGLRPGYVAVLLHRAKRDMLRCMTE